MKKLLYIVALVITLNSNTYADKILNSGYLIPTKNWSDEIKINENFRI